MGGEAEIPRGDPRPNEFVTKDAYRIVSITTVALITITTTQQWLQLFEKEFENVFQLGNARSPLRVKREMQLPYLLKRAVLGPQLLDVDHRRDDAALVDLAHGGDALVLRVLPHRWSARQERGPHE